MVLRLSPDVPVVWRNPFDVQLGVDDVRLVLREVAPGQERLLAALTAGISEAGYAMIAKSAGVDAADAARPAHGARARPACRPRAAPAPRVEVLGAGPVATGLAALVTDPAAAGPPDFAILVADWVVSPADHGTWLRRDIPHLPVVLGDGGATIGPFVEPGLGPCLHCVHRARAGRRPGLAGDRHAALGSAGARPRPGDGRRGGGVRRPADPRARRTRPGSRRGRARPELAAGRGRRFGQRAPLVAASRVPVRSSARKRLGSRRCPRRPSLAQERASRRRARVMPT